MRDNNMKGTKERKLAGFLSLVAAVANFAVIAITINIGTFAVFTENLSLTSPLMIVASSAIISSIIGLVLLTTIKLGKKFLLTALIVSILIFAIAAIQKSIVVMSVLLWPWSLYRLYRSEIA
jgi:hypothetical protein